MHSRTTAVVAALLVLTAGIGAVGTASATAQEDCSFPVTETDATGTDVTIDDEPQRVVSLAPSAAQTMWEIGAEEKVVGVSQHATYLDGAEERTNVSGAGDSSVNTEVVVSLEPDLVLAPNVVPDDTVEQLRDAGLTVYKYEMETSIEDVYDSVRLTGQLTGECEGASETVDWMQEEIGIVEEAVEGEERPRALYVFFGYAAGNGTFIDEIIETAGGDNVAADAGIEGYAEISEEVVAEQNPEWIVLNDESPTVPQTEAYNNTDAVQKGQTVTLDRNLLNQPAPRIVYPIVTLAEAFHPEAYEEANDTSTETAAETPTESPGSADDGDSANDEAMEADVDDETESPGQPGFGVPIAVAALTIVGLLARRV